MLFSAPAQLSTMVKHDRFEVESVGGRFGVGGNLSSFDFHEAEVFLNFSLPSDWDLGKHWISWARLDTSAGWLGDPGHNAFVASVGPALVLARPPIPVTLEAGAKPTLITQWEFGTKNLGMPFQIASHVGLNFEMGRSFRLSYRYQHMSNCGLSSHNQGLNLHLLGFSYVF